MFRFMLINLKNIEFWNSLKNGRSKNGNSSVASKVLK